MSSKSKVTKEELETEISLTRQQVCRLEEQLATLQLKHQEECNSYLEQIKTAEINYVELEAKYGRTLNDLFDCRSELDSTKKVCETQLVIIERLSKLVP